jgi:hypothetical protein
MTATQELVVDLKALVRFIDGKVGPSGAIIVALTSLLVIIVSFWAVNTWA